jgi:hypothetical protein
MEVQNKMKSKDIRNGTAHRVVTALVLGGDMTYAELIENVGISKNPLMEAMRELRSLGLVQTYTTGKGRIQAVRLTLPSQPLVCTVYELCVKADETADQDEQIDAMMSTLQERFPLGSYSGKTPTRRDARRWLNQTGSAVAFYELLEQSKGKAVKAPINYISTMIVNDGVQPKRTRPSNGVVKPGKPVQEYTNEVEITPDMWKLVEIGRKQFGDKKAV